MRGLLFGLGWYSKCLVGQKKDIIDTEELSLSCPFHHSSNFLCKQTGLVVLIRHCFLQVNHGSDRKKI